jgi:hypothetical protein
VQTCFTTTTVGEGIVEGQQHTVDINTDCQVLRTDVTKTSNSTTPTELLAGATTRLNTTDSISGSVSFDQATRSFKIPATNVFFWSTHKFGVSHEDEAAS